MNKGLKDKILKLFNDGKSYNEISRLLKCSKGSVSFHCSKLKIKSDKYSEENLKKYMKHYESYKNLRRTARYFNLNVGYLRLKLNVRKGKLTEMERKSNRKKSVCDWRRRKKIKAVEYKGGRCQNCKYNKSHFSLDFHHINPKEKDFSIAQVNRNWEKTKKELDKCILVCSNCHGEIHEEIHEKGYSDILNNIIFLRSSEAERRPVKARVGVS